MAVLQVNLVYAILALFTVLIEAVDTTFLWNITQVKNIAAVSGNTVHLPCLENLNISNCNFTFDIHWKKNGTLCHYQITQKGTKNLRCQSRYTLEGNPAQLYLQDVQLSDSGVYNCSVAKVIPPPAEDKIHNLQLHVIDINIERLDTQDKNCSRFLCKVRGQSQAGFNFTWVAERKENDSNCLSKKNSTSWSSTVETCGCSWSEEDSVTCCVSFPGSSTGLNKSILYHLPKGCESCQNLHLLIVFIVLPVAIVLISVIIGAVMCKRRKQHRIETVVFTNKVYENFSFSTPVVPATFNQEKSHEHCIYEN